MKAQLYLEKIPQPPLALVIGSQNNLGLYLSSQLLDQGLAVNLILSHAEGTTNLQLLNSLKSNPGLTLSQIENLTLSKPSSQNSLKPTYIFHIFDYSQTALKTLQSAVELAVNNSAKLTLIAQPPDPTMPGHHAKLSKAHQLIATALKTQHLNARVAHLNHLFGPSITTSPANPLYPILHSLSNNNLSLPSDHQRQAYPLFITDAARGIVRSAFSSNSKGNIFELAGDPITLLNFSLKVRSLIPSLKSINSNHHPTITASDLPAQITKTHQQLNWHPTTSLDDAITQTINWISSHATPPSLAPPVDFQPKTDQLLVKARSAPLFNSVSSVINPPIQESSQTPSTTPLFDQHPPKQGSAASSPRKFTINGKSPPLLKMSQPPNLETTQGKNIQPDQVETFDKSTKRVKEAKPLNSKKHFLPKFNKPSLPAFKGINFHLSHKFIAGLLLIFLILAAPLTIFSYNLYQTIAGFNSIKASLETKDTTRLQAQAQTTLSRLNTIQSNLVLVEPLISFFTSKQTSSNISKLLSIAKSTTTAILDTTLAVDAATELFSGITNQETNNLPPIITDTDTAIMRAYHSLSHIEAQLNANHHLFTIKQFQIGTNLEILESTIQSSKPQLLKAHQLLAHSQSLLGFDSKKTYLVLLQNSAELRPTGGFIGSFALITFESGKLLDVKVEDIYAADGQLRGHVEPPAAIKEHLGEAGWFFRDVNWDPNFSTTATRAAWFLNKELNIQADGVIGLNLQVIKPLLAIVGPVEIPDYQETVTVDNFFERLQYQVEINQFPGSTQKQDFLGKLSSHLIDQVLNSDQSHWLNLGSSLITSANQGQLQFFSTDPATQQTLEDINWAGQLQSSPCQQISTSQNCLTDFLALIEANVGVNKANYFTTRAINHQVSLQPDGQVVATTTLKLNNHSPGVNWPGGSYKNYFRLYTPMGSTLNAASINNKTISTSTIDITNQHGKTVYGFLVETPPQETTTTKISYQLNQPFPSTTPAAYTLFVFNQPGTPADSFNFSLSTPNNLQLISSNQSTQSQTGPFNFATTLDQNMQYIFEFAR